MTPGQFWPISLSGGRFACGRVLAIGEKNGKRDQVGFLAGLMNWFSDQEPNAENIAGCGLLAQGMAHLKTITEHYGMITGCRNLSLDCLQPLLWSEHRRESEWGLYRGYELIRIISKTEAENYPTRSTWGFSVINRLAETKWSTQQDAALNRMGWRPFCE